MGNTPTPRSKEKQPSLSEEIVELKPPEDSGFSGTRLCHAKAEKHLIQFLLARGYTVVSQKAGEE